MFFEFGFESDIYFVEGKSLEFRFLTDREKGDVLKQIAKEFIEHFNKQVDKQMIWDDKEPLSRNQPYTLNLKAQKGWGDKTLIAKDRDFLNPDQWDIALEKDAVIISMKSRLREKYLSLDKWTYPPYNKNYTESAPSHLKKEDWEWIFKRLEELIIDKFVKMGGI